MPEAFSIKDDFAPVSLETWREAVERDIPVEKLVTQIEGLAARALYSEAPDQVMPEWCRPAPPSCLIRADHDLETLTKSPHTIQADLENGVDIVGIDIPERVGLLDPLDLRERTLVLRSANVGNFATLASELFDNLHESTALQFGFDPLGTLASAGVGARALDETFDEMTRLAERAAQRSNTRAVDVGTHGYVDAGANAVQEIAFAVATGIAYLRTLDEGGTSAGNAAGVLTFSVSVDADFAVSIAKLRALRWLWNRVMSECGAPDADRVMFVHARTARRILTKRDPWVNILRGTVSSFAAAVGGADSIRVLPFDAALGRSEPHAQRVARNTSLVLRHESHLFHVQDPAGGSGYFEALTSELAHDAWALVREIEQLGGMRRALAEGFVANSIGEVRRARDANIRKRKNAIVGVSEFANLNETPLQRSQNETPEAAAPALPRLRFADSFEALRDASDAYSNRHGQRPRAFVATLGPLAEHSARSSWVDNVLAAGGIESDIGAGFDDVQSATDAYASSGAAVVVLAGADSRYETMAEPLAAGLAEAGARAIVFAGPPGDREPAFRAAGVTHFVHLGVDVVDLLSELHRALEVEA